jgi:hypothetical protein
MDESGSCSFEELLYNPIAVKLGGAPSHFRRWLLMCLSMPSTD